MAVAPVTGSKSQIMSCTYWFDVLVRMAQGDVCKSFKEILQLLMPELKSVDLKIAPSPTMCLTRVL